jgi:hypothetical protein
MVETPSHEIPDNLWETKIVYKNPCPKPDNQDGELHFSGITQRQWVLT